MIFHVYYIRIMWHVCYIIYCPKLKLSFVRVSTFCHISCMYTYYHPTHIDHKMYIILLHSRDPEPSRWQHWEKGAASEHGIKHNIGLTSIKTKGYKGSHITQSFPNATAISRSKESKSHCKSKFQECISTTRGIYGSLRNVWKPFPLAIIICS